MGFKNLFGGLRKSKDYLTMTAEELAALDNDDLRDAVSARMMKETEGMQVQRCLDTFSGAKKTFYIVSLYDMELTDSLCRFLVGPSRSTTGYILDALEEIRARKHASLLRRFTKENGIDLNDLGDLRIDTSWEYAEQKARYPFDEFDEKFRKLYDTESIDEKLMQFARNNINQF